MVNTKFRKMEASRVARWGKRGGEVNYICNICFTIKENKLEQIEESVSIY